MTKTLAELQVLCDRHGITVATQRRPAKEPYLLAFRDHPLGKERPNQPLPELIELMLLGDWNDLGDGGAEALERDESGWCVQEKHDGVRALLHVTQDGVRITGRTVSEATFRLSEFAANVPHLTRGFEHLVGTVLDVYKRVALAPSPAGLTMSSDGRKETSGRRHAITMRGNCPSGSRSRPGHPGCKPVKDVRSESRAILCRT